MENLKQLRWRQKKQRSLPSPKPERNVPHITAWFPRYARFHIAGVWKIANVGDGVRVGRTVTSWRCWQFVWIWSMHSGWKIKRKTSFSAIFFDYETLRLAAGALFFWKTIFQITLIGPYYHTIRLFLDLTFRSLLSWHALSTLLNSDESQIKSFLYT